MEIANCRWCKAGHQDCFLSQYNTGMYYVRSRCAHTLHGPSCATKEEAISMWNEMMGSSVPVTLETASTDYRDRVDRIVAAMLAGFYANPTLGNISDDKIANWAISQIDAIDTMLKEREALGEVKK